MERGACYPTLAHLAHAPGEELPPRFRYTALAGGGAPGGSFVDVAERRLAGFLEDFIRPAHADQPVAADRT